MTRFEGEAARVNAHWAKCKLVAGSGTWQSQTCLARVVGTCRTGGGAMSCACAAWQLIQPFNRTLILAVRSGLPIALIQRHRFEDGRDLERLSTITAALCEVQPVRGHVERLTERVPMWGERPRRPILRLVPTEQVPA